MSDRGTTCAWIERVPDDDEAPPSERHVGPVPLCVEWPRDPSGVREIPPGGDHSVVLNQFWHAASYGAVPKGWLFAAYGPHRGNRQSSPDAASLFKAAPRTAAVVTLFRQDAGLDGVNTWLTELELRAARRQGADATALRDGILRLLGHGLLVPDEQTPMKVESDGLYVKWQGAWRPARLLGDGYYSTLALVADLLLRIEQFRPGRLLEDILRWAPEPDAAIGIEPGPSLGTQGYGADDEVFVDDTDTMLALQEASAAHRAALGTRAGKKTRRMQMLGGREFPLPPRCAVYEGYNLHANVVVGAHDREALRRLCRYIARPPLAKSRLEEREDGALVLRMKRAWSDGTTSIVFDAVELIGKLVALIPPRHFNLTSYAGVFASRSALRAEVVPTPPPDDACKKLCEHPSSSSRWVPWARLLKLVFGVDGWACPRCGEQMELRCILRGPRVIGKILVDLSQSSRGPPQPPAAFT